MLLSLEVAGRSSETYLDVDDIELVRIVQILKSVQKCLCNNVK